MKLKFIIPTVMYVMAAVSAFAQHSSTKGTIYVNEDVTTHIIMPESIKLVDLSTQRMVGNQCADNMIRMKPVFEIDSLGNVIKPEPYELLGAVTIIGERRMTQYEVRYAASPKEAHNSYTVMAEQLTGYTNPDVSMPEALMAKYAWAIYCSGRKFNNITANGPGLKAVVNNIYSVGNYFFLDYSIYNKSNIPYDIADTRLKLDDKKISKATNVQSIELTPVFSLNLGNRFNKAYRNVLVVEKLTFPNDKVLSLEVSEDMISGRVVTLTMEYEDVLNADAFSHDLIKHLDSDNRIHITAE